MSDLIVERAGALGRIRLNRPKALNSLTMQMIHGIGIALDDFACDPAVAAVLVSGEGERGLCAGGDIRALYDSGRAGTSDASDFFRAEYAMNARIAHYSKPYIAIMDGITMGGGVGISAHGSIRIVTERTRMAMPETGIGFFPDVGGTFLLPCAPGETGTYIGLTGAQIGGADAIYAGFADYFVPTQNLPALIEALAAVGKDTVREAVAPFTTTPETAPLATNRAEIDQIFAVQDVEQIIARLEQSATPFAAETLKVLLTKSPTSLKLTLRLLRLGGTSATLEECLEREFAGCQRILASHDFYEGVRAAVVDKDRNPKWSPATLAEVTGAEVESYLTADIAPIF
jgi:enoyl-CoA hydratase